MRRAPHPRVGGRRHRRLLAGGLCLLTSALVACTDPAGSPPSPSVPAGSPEASSPEASETVTSSPSPSSPGSSAPPSNIPADPEASVDESGHVTKLPGEGAELLSGDGSVAATVTVYDTEVMTECPGEFAEPPQHGSYVVVDVAVAATDALGEGNLLLVGPAMWTIVGPDGAVQRDMETTAAWTCFATEERLPYTVAPGESVRGRLVLDTTTTTGQLVYSPNGGEGWSWPLD